MRDVKVQLDEFLAHKQKKVLMLKGKWGVGKTFFWKKYIREKKTDELLEKKLSYVSLFGVGNTEEVEQLVLCKTVYQGKPRKWLERRLTAIVVKLDRAKGIPLVGWFARLVRQVASLVKRLLKRSGPVGGITLDWLKDVPKVGQFAGLVRRVASLFVKDYLVCFDDIERRDKRLTLAALLGFVSVLKEENNCRIVLILNEQELSDVDKAALQKYREKVVDEEISYEPSVEDNVRLIYGSSPHVDFYIDLFKLLDLKNIRVMQQTQWAVEYFAPFLEGILPSLQTQVLQHVVYLSAFFHERSLNVSLRELALLSDEDHVFNAAAKHEERLKELERLISQYRFYPQDYDSFIADYIENGSCDEKRFQGELSKANEREQRSQVVEKLRVLWQYYTANLQTQDAELIEKFQSFLDQYAGDLAERDFAAITRFLKDIGYKGGFDHWQDAFITGHLADFRAAELETWLPFASTEALKMQIRERQEAIRAARTIPYLLHGIMNGHWSEDEVALLDSYGVNQFYEWLRTSPDPELLTSARQLCRHFSAAGVGSAEQSIKAKLFEALRKLATESKSNEIRVRDLFKGVLKEPAASGVGDPATEGKQI